MLTALQITYKIIFIQSIWDCSFISEKKLCSPWNKLLETSTFYPIFTSFHSGWGVRYFNILTQETLYPSFISAKSWPSPLQTFFETSTFYHFFTWGCSFISKKYLCSPSHKFLETFTFYYMPTSFHKWWVVQYFKEIPIS